ncbi:MAG: hypothetical protein H2172_12470 [Opitutus sp.]|nr:hypothetical protein [Opitutus sp.]MCS6248689.1 hypothetical protein [Opitutus sp.]MCS6275919.1 hypothetical protein [Opitutus sp.]MCS6301016.1 hypothetical protein [Opitutus sp.]
MLIEILLITIGVLLVIIAVMAYQIGHYKAFVLFDSEHYEARIQCLLDRVDAAEALVAAPRATGLFPDALARKHETEAHHRWWQELLRKTFPVRRRGAVTRHSTDQPRSHRLSRLSPTLSLPAP